MLDLLDWEGKEEIFLRGAIATKQSLGMQRFEIASLSLAMTHNEKAQDKPKDQHSQAQALF